MRKLSEKLDSHFYWKIILLSDDKLDWLLNLNTLLWQNLNLIFFFWSSYEFHLLSEIITKALCCKRRLKLYSIVFVLVSIFSSIRRSHFFKSVSLLDEGPLQDDPALLVPLLLLHGKLVHPSQLFFALFTVNIANPVATGEHHSLGRFTGKMAIKNKYKSLFFTTIIVYIQSSIRQL